MSQKRDDETFGEELFMEELGQVQGGIQLPINVRPMISLGLPEAEGIKEPLPRPTPTPRPRFPFPIVTQGLHEVGSVPPVPRF